jgi:hypothetical protein
VIRWGIPAVRRRILHQAIGSLTRASSQPATRTTSCTLATLPACLVCSKRSKVMPPPCPAQGMHTCMMYPIPDAYDLSSFSLAVCNQSICRAHIQPSHVLIIRTVSSRVKVTCLPLPVCPNFDPSPPSAYLPPPPSCHQINPMPPAAVRLLPSHPPAIPLYTRPPPFLPFLPPLAVARPHAHHVGNAEATRYCTLLCAAESRRRRRQTVRRGGVGARSCRCGKGCRPQHCEHCSRVPAGRQPAKHSGVHRLAAV